VFADLAVADSEFLAQPQITGIYDGLVIEYAEEEPALLVAVMHAHPHPFAGKARSVCRKFNFHVITAIILGHFAPRKFSVEEASARNHTVVLSCRLRRIWVQLGCNKTSWVLLSALEVATGAVTFQSEESNALDHFSNPQLNPQHATSCATFNDLGGPWQSPRFCKL